jgi:hypothetical protein
MRTAHNEPRLQSAFHSARHEAEKAFGNDQVYLEKLITIRITSNFRLLPIVMVALSIWANAIVPFSDAIRK